MKKLISILFLLCSCSYMNTEHTDYMYTGALVGQDTAIKRINHAKGQEKEIGAVIGLERSINRSRYGIEIEYDKRTIDSGLRTINCRLVYTYSLLQKGPWEAFAGIAGGLGWSGDDGYKLLQDEDNDSSGLTGVMDFRTGVRLKVTRDVQLKLQYKLNHVSRPFVHDPGSNTDCVEFGIVIEF